MSLPKFEYLAPKTLEEACSLLYKHKGEAKMIAGGTDLLVKMKKREIVLGYVIGLTSIPDLDYISHDKNHGLRIGALTTHSSILNSPVIRTTFGPLSDAAGDIATTQIRNLGTIGGNLCNASPGADTAPPLIALNATVKIVGLKGERIVLLEDFFIEPGKTVLEADEIVTEIQVPNPPPRTGGVYLKLCPRTSVDVATVGVATCITLGSKNVVCSDTRIVLGAVAPKPIRARKAEALIKGTEIGTELIDEAALLASREARPISDVRSSADYTTEMVWVITKRAIGQALERAKSA